MDKALTNLFLITRPTPSERLVSTQVQIHWFCHRESTSMRRPSSSWKIMNTLTHIRISLSHKSSPRRICLRSRVLLAHVTTLSAMPTFSTCRGLSDRHLNVAVRSRKHISQSKASELQGRILRHSRSLVASSSLQPESDYTRTSTPRTWEWQTPVRYRDSSMSINLLHKKRASDTWATIIIKTQSIAFLSKIRTSPK